MKKTLLYFLVFTLIMSVNVYAEETVDVTIPGFPVELQGETINNVYNDYPMIVYNGITYLPMTWDFSSTLGLKTNFYSGKGLFIEKSDQTMPLKQSTNSLNDTTKTYKAALPSFNVHVNGKMLNNSAEEYPILVFRDITYFPLTWRWTVEEFGLQSDFNAATGLTIKNNVSIDNSSNNTTMVSDVNNSTVAVTNNNIDNSVSDSNNTYIDNSVTIINHIDNSITVTDQDNLNVTGVIVADTSNDETKENSSASVNATDDSKEKYSVDTLVGGVESGYVNGHVSEARISYARNLMVDENNDIYFTNQDSEVAGTKSYGHSHVRKLNTTKNEVSTVFTQDYEDKLGRELLESVLRNENDFHIAYNNYNDKFYVVYKENNKDFLKLFEIDDQVREIAHIDTPVYSYYDVALFLNFNNEVVYFGVSDRSQYYDSCIYKYKLGNESPTAVSKRTTVHKSIVDILYSDEMVYTYSFGYSSYVHTADGLYQIKEFPKTEVKVEVDDSFLDRSGSITTYNNAFYRTSGANIYKLDLDGEWELYVDADDLIYNDGEAIKFIGSIAFDTNGDIIIYDRDHFSIRRINMN
ncbi:hypothetical protein EZV73_09900 [Acidaminobacter sp. JC074]|uniref:hypothetical protein n=1 Tax=Acidaminobacter sp. JC074 TaxID=2530199 RepID=UPI001F0E3551|nr:hypothetical protein [Acidaminobacter sp. JC074]MCH4887887.1 hypothetical protein [Acidaminobacter sp. JC074]